MAATSSLPRTICDYIAGMTDGFILQQHRKPDRLRNCSFFPHPDEFTRSNRSCHRGRNSAPVQHLVF